MTERVISFSDDKQEEDHASGHRHRFKDRFMRAGREALQDYELLELILFRSIPRRDVKHFQKNSSANLVQLPKCWVRRLLAYAQPKA